MLPVSQLTFVSAFLHGEFLLCSTIPNTWSLFSLFTTAVNPCIIVFASLIKTLFYLSLLGLNSWIQNLQIMMGHSTLKTKLSLGTVYSIWFRLFLFYIFSIKRSTVTQQTVRCIKQYLAALTCTMLSETTKTSHWGGTIHQSISICWLNDL